MNVNPYSPRTRPLVKNTVLHPKSLWGVDILEAGTLDVIDIDGNTVSYNFEEFDATQPGSYTLFPYRLQLQINQILSSSTVPDASIIPLI